MYTIKVQMPGMNEALYCMQCVKMFLIKKWGHLKAIKCLSYLEIQILISVPKQATKLTQ